MRFLFRLAVAIIALSAGAVHSQEPGSQQYNSVFLPAHGVGDTQQPRRRLSWGAFSVSEADENEAALSGWAVGYQTEADASAAALMMCSERGGINCTINLAFANQCAAVATSDNETVASREDTLRQARKSAMQACGRDCEILYAGCSNGR
ncbi:DUF4189 domain-containing protein [Luteimonas terrae]|uniref:DUF4189 domain-containing protein n=1 Tax=Luteimonas terrae TaxID=1530191 RepID=A0A4R5U724_9GAMM|nr:DUF4189 domain-containing protein [Luteimonas terrae]